MKKVKVIESFQVDFHPDSLLNESQLKQISGGLCNKNPFNINGVCTCDDNCFLRVGRKQQEIEEVTF